MPAGTLYDHNAGKRTLFYDLNLGIAYGINGDGNSYKHRCGLSLVLLMAGREVLGGMSDRPFFVPDAVNIYLAEHYCLTYWTFARGFFIFLL